MIVSKNTRPLVENRRVVYAIAIVAVIVLLVSVFWVRQRQHQAEAAQLQQIHHIGKAWEQGGRLSESDYVRVRSLSTQIMQTGAVTDPELNWLLGLLKEHSDSIIHAKVLAILSELKTVPAAQRERISAVLPPLLQSPNALESRPAQRVRDMLARTGKG